MNDNIMVIISNRYQGQPATQVPWNGHESEDHKVSRFVSMRASYLKIIKSHAYQLFDILVDEGNWDQFSINEMA